MRPSKRPIIIATRQSELALAQANAVANVLKRIHPGVHIELLPMTTEADQITDHPLARFGGKGLFTGKLEATLLQEKADIAVHSLKDMPTEPTHGLIIAAIPKRGDRRDCFISHAPDLASLPQGATVGTASPRRAAQLLMKRPDLNISLLRGNVQTRYRKVMEDQEFDATLLAMAGLQRSGMAEVATKPLSIEEMMPAPGQGALAIQCRADDHVTLRRCLSLNHSISSSIVQAERQVVQLLDADCHSPVAAHAEFLAENQLQLTASVFAIDGSKAISVTSDDKLKHVGKLCRRLAEELKDKGADELLQMAREAS